MCSKNDRDDHPAFHSLLEKVPAIVPKETQELSDYLWANPRIAEAIKWIHDNVDPIFTPKPLGMFWNGFFNYEGKPNRPITLTTKGPPSV